MAAVLHTTLLKSGANIVRANLAFACLTYCVWMKGCEKLKKLPCLLHSFNKKQLVVNPKLLMYLYSGYMASTSERSVMSIPGHHNQSILLPDLEHFIQHSIGTQQTQ